MAQRKIRMRFIFRLKEIWELCHSGRRLVNSTATTQSYTAFTDIVTGVDPAKFAGGTGRIGEDVKRGFGFGADGRPLATSSTGGGPAAGAARNDGADVAGDGDIIDENALEAEDLSEGNGIIRGRHGRPPTKVSTVAKNCRRQET